MNEIEADLAGAPINGVNPRGDAEFEIEGADREFRVRVENVNLPAGTQLRVFVDSQYVGNIVVASGLRRSELRLKTEDGQTVPQVNSRTRVVVADAAGATLLAGSFSNIPQPLPNPGPAPMPSPGPNGDTRIESRLAGAPINGLVPTGHARFRTRADGRRQLNVEVEKVNLPAGTILSVFVDGTRLGDVVLASTMEAELERNSGDGQFVPVVTTATTVVVTDAAGRTIVGGGFNTAGLPITARNDVDDTTFFVEQQYRDFLGREADDGGLAFWAGIIRQCGETRDCIDKMRVNTSAAFFLSIEFQETGYLLYRLNVASYGEMPRRNPFLLDLQAVSRGVVVGTAGWQQKLEENRQAMLAAWVARPEFRSRYDSLTDEQYVDALLRNANIQNQQLRDGLLAGIRQGGHTRASVLRAVADRDELRRAEFNKAFVLMQYFGYLHRNPDEGPDRDFSGFQFWLDQLNRHNGNFVTAELVKAFILSLEYRRRFEWREGGVAQEPVFLY